jgi:hypothetical protein
MKKNIVGSEIKLKDPTKRVQSFDFFDEQLWWRKINFALENAVGFWENFFACGHAHKDLNITYLFTEQQLQYLYNKIQGAVDIQEFLVTSCQNFCNNYNYKGDNKRVIATGHDTVKSFWIKFDPNALLESDAANYELKPLIYRGDKAGYVFEKTDFENISDCFAVTDMNVRKDCILKLLRKKLRSKIDASLDKALRWWRYFCTYDYGLPHPIDTCPGQRDCKYTNI